MALRPLVFLITKSVFHAKLIVEELVTLAEMGTKISCEFIVVFTIFFCRLSNEYFDKTLCITVILISLEIK